MYKVIVESVSNNLLKVLAIIYCLIYINYVLRNIYVSRVSIILFTNYVFDNVS